MVIKIGDRDLIVDPLGIIVEFESTFLSSGYKIDSEDFIGISRLSKSFDNSVWFHFSISFLSVCLLSIIITRIHSKMYSDQLDYQRVIFSSCWYYFRSILNQCKYISNFIIHLFSNYFFPKIIAIHLI